MLDKLKGENEDQRHGVQMVKKALSWPARQIAINAGEDGSVIVGKIQDNETYAFGFDAQTGKFENLVARDYRPTKVVRTALQDAASIAGLLITTEAMVAESAQEGNAHARHATRGRDGLLIGKTVSDLLSDKSEGYTHRGSMDDCSVCAFSRPASYTRCYAAFGLTAWRARATRARVAS